MNISHRDQQVNPCTGCGICAIVCSQGCISVLKNKNGFFEAVVDNSGCVDCGLCKKVCHKYHERPNEFKHAFKNTPIYAVWSKDRALLNTCASGGFATELSKLYFEKGYNVCGVAYDNDIEICKHLIARDFKDIDKFIGSKYLQSYTVDAFSHFNSQGKYIVFGTPCQIFGLRQYIQLKKLETNFILIDFFCHGIPSYNLWAKYLDTLRMKGIQQIEKINFVSKRKGWHNRNILINNGSDNEYIKDYQSDLFGIFYGGKYCHNTPCFDCPFRIDSVYSDIRIADFWGSRFKSNQSGVNLLTINTEVGKSVFHSIRDTLHVEDANFDDLRNSKPWRFYSRPLKYNKIMIELQSKKSLYTIFNMYVRLFLFTERLLHRLNRMWKRFI